MMQTIPHDRYVFEPEIVEAMTTAYLEACIALHVFAGDQNGRETVASHVIHLASTGIRDSSKLRDSVVRAARFGWKASLALIAGPHGRATRKPADRRACAKEFNGALDARVLGGLALASSRLPASAEYAE